MTTDMKPWQKGYELDYLLGIESVFKEHYNPFTYGPFSEVKKHRIAAALADKALHAITNNNKIVGWYESKISKTPSKIVMYQDLVVGQKEKGDRTVSKFVSLPGHETQMVTVLQMFQEPTWVVVPEEDVRSVTIVKQAGYVKVGTKYTGFAEIFGVYFKDSFALFPREHPQVEPMEYINIAQAKDKSYLKYVPAIAEKVKELEYKAHYSNYNKGKVWGGVSLRGFFPDPSRIEKPVEMDDKWWAKNPGEHPNQDTPLRKEFPEVEKILKDLGDPEVERIRLLRLQPGGGGKEIGRHSDLTDLDTGPRDHQVGRLHIPVITNEHVQFSSWNDNGQCDTVNMKLGELWYLDARRPHRVVNEGKEDRIHLVIDCHFTDKIRKLFV